MKKGLRQMAHTALYRKFRPDAFDQVKGQEHIVRTLRNQIKSGKPGHAYLFCGTRGTGKTSIAKLFAKTVNCESPLEGSPCCECRFCKSAESGTSMNVIEIDAASNNGVENIRQIREEVQYSPAEGKYKVYIIDEVHMLSMGAFNALLKTLEEPPSYVIFILATTEVHKIPVTILSRCQRYDFKRITVDIITSRLRELADIEHIKIEEKALRYIAKAGDGSLRDALSLLDRCAAFFMGQDITYEDALEVLGTVDTEVFSRMLRVVIDGNAAMCIRLLEEVIMAGRDLSQFIIDFTWYMRNMLLIKTSGDTQDIIDLSSEQLLALKEESALIETDTLMRYIRVLSELSNQMKYASSKRVLAEIALIKLTRPAMETDISSVIDRLSIIEKQLEDGIVTTVSSAGSETKLSINKSKSSIEKEANLLEGRSNKQLDIPIPEDVQYIVDHWFKIEKKLPKSIKGYYKYGKLSVNGSNKLLVVFDAADGIAYDMLNRPDHIRQLEEFIGNETGKAIQVEMRQLEENQHYSDHFMMVRQKIKMDIEEEDF